MDIEGSGDFADGLSFFNEMANEGALLRQQFGRAPEGDATCLGGATAFLSSGGDQRALELRDASKDGEHHAPGRRRRIGPGLGNGLQSGVFCLDSLRDAQQLERGAREAAQASDDNDVIGAQLGEQALERSGRFWRAPEVFSSNSFSQPAASRRSRWMERSWSVVDTRAYPSFMHPDPLACKSY